MSRVVVSTSMKGLNLVPNNILLSGVEFELAMLHGREYVLREQLSCVNNSYDICVIDCSPSLSLLTLNALVASTDVLIPVQTHYYALEGLRQLFETIAIVKERFNGTLEILGVLLTFVESRTMLSNQVQRQMREFFADLVFETVIHRTVRLAEAPSAGESILTYAPESKGAAEYKALAEEITNGRRSTGETKSDKVPVEVVSDDEASGEDVNQGEVSAEGTTEEEASTGETKSDKVPVEVVSDDEASGEDVNQGEVSAEGTIKEEASTGETKSDKVPVEVVSDDEASDEDVNQCEVSAEGTIKEEASTGETKSDKVPVEVVSDHEASAEDVNQSEVSAEGTTEGEASTGEASNDKVSVEVVGEHEASAEDVNQGEVSAKETNDDKG
jgi:chromosome partitioning protein